MALIPAPATESEQRLTVYLFAFGIMAMGALSVVSGDFAYNWQPVPAFPGRAILAVLCGLFMIGCSAALLVRSTTAIAARLMLPFLLAWLALKVPALFVAPQIEGVWLNFGEIGTVFAGGMVLFAQLSGLEGRALFAPLTGRRGVRAAQIMFGLSVIPIGLAHIVYSAITAGMVPSWLPFHLGLAYFTGIAQMACGAAILLGVVPRLAALGEAAMCALFAFLVWGPDTWFAAVPKFPNMPDAHRFPLTAFLITWIVGSAALLIASSAAARARPGKESSAVDPLLGAAG